MLRALFPEIFVLAVGDIDKKFLSARSKKSCFRLLLYSLEWPYKVLCPFAVYYLRYGVRSFFTMYRIPPADGKTAGQKVQCKIAVAVQKVKTFVLFIPLF